MGRCDVAVATQVLARPSKGFQRVLGIEVPERHVVGVEMWLLWFSACGSPASSRASPVLREYVAKNPTRYIA